MSEEKKRLIIIESSIGLTGAFKSIFIYASHLKGDYDITFLIPSKSSNSETLDEHGLKYKEYPYLPISKSIKTLLLPFFLIYQYSILFKLIRKGTIVHSNDMINLLGVFAKIFSPSIKLIYHIRLMSDSYISGVYPLLKKVIEWKTDKILAVSKGAALPFRGGVTVVPNSFDLSFLEFQNFNLSQEPIRFLYMANYTNGKGQLMALKAFKILLKEIKNIEIEFVGDTFGEPNNIAFKEGLIKYVNDHSLTNHVLFRQGAKNVIEKYLTASVFLNFSNSESFSRTVLEAMILGIPVISTKSGGPQELIIDKSNGLLIDVDSVEEAFKAMFLLVKDEELRLSLGKKARLSTIEKYTIQNGVAILNRIYDKLKT